MLMVGTTILCLVVRIQAYLKGFLCVSILEKAIRIPMNDEHVRSLKCVQHCLYDCLQKHFVSNSLRGLELSHRYQHDKVKIEVYVFSYKEYL